MLAVVLFLPVALADSPQFQGDACNSGYVPYLFGDEGELTWQTDIGAGDSSPALVGDMLYVGSADGHLYAVDAGSGEVAWKTLLGTLETDEYGFERMPAVQPAPAFVDGRVIAASRDGRVAGLDAGDGEIVWSRDVGVDLRADITIDGERVLLAVDNRIVALNSGSGDVVWDSGPLGSRMFRAPASDGGRVYAGGWSGHVFALDLDDGSLVWKTDLTYKVDSIPLVKDGMVYVGSAMGGRYGLDVETGDVVWSDSGQRGTSYRNNPVGYRDHVLFMGNFDDSLAADAKTGDVVWRLDGPQQSAGSPLVVGQSLFTNGGHNTLVKRSVMDGELEWEYTTQADGGNGFSAPVASGDGGLFYASRDDFLYRFDFPVVGEEDWLPDCPAQAAALSPGALIPGVSAIVALGALVGVVFKLRVRR